MWTGPSVVDAAISPLARRRLELFWVVDPDFVRVGHRCRRVCDMSRRQVQRARPDANR